MYVRVFEDDQLMTEIFVGTGAQKSVRWLGLAIGGGSDRVLSRFRVPAMLRDRKTGCLLDPRMELSSFQELEVDVHWSGTSEWKSQAYGQKSQLMKHTFKWIGKATELPVGVRGEFDPHPTWAPFFEGLLDQTFDLPLHAKGPYELQADFLCIPGRFSYIYVFEDGSERICHNLANHDGTKHFETVVWDLPMNEQVFHMEARCSGSVEFSSDDSESPEFSSADLGVTQSGSSSEESDQI